MKEKLLEDTFENLLKIHYDKNKDKKFILIRVFDSHDCERGLFKCGQKRTKFQHMLNKLFKDLKEEIIDLLCIMELKII